MFFPKTNREGMEHFSARRDVKIPATREFRSFSKLKHFEYVETSLIACNKATVLQVKAEPAFLDYLMCIIKKCSSYVGGNMNSVLLSSLE